MLQKRLIAGIAWNSKGLVWVMKYFHNWTCLPKPFQNFTSILSANTFIGKTVCANNVKKIQIPQKQAR